MRNIVRYIARVYRRKKLIITTTTGFFRNFTQLEVVHNLMPEMETVYVFGCSDGCEAYSLAMFYKEKKPSANFNISAYYLDQSCIDHAIKAIYRGMQLDYYGDGSIFNEPWLKYFRNLGDGAFSVETSIREHCSFAKGDILNDAFMNSLEPVAMVFCQNVLIHLTKRQNQKALELLYRLIKPVPCW